MGNAKKNKDSPGESLSILYFFIFYPSPICVSVISVFDYLFSIIFFYLFWLIGWIPSSLTLCVWFWFSGFTFCVTLLNSLWFFCCCNCSCFFLSIHDSLNGFLFHNLLNGYVLLLCTNCTGIYDVSSLYSCLLHYTILLHK